MKTIFRLIISTTVWLSIWIAAMVLSKFIVSLDIGCEDSIAAIFGVILTISLVIAFLFFMLYNYSKQTKTKYIGNGINVNHIKHISKPIPSGVNPYSTKVEHIVDLPKEEPTITTIEIPTISVIHHGTRSSFMMLSSL